MINKLKTLMSKKTQLTQNVKEPTVMANSGTLAQEERMRISVKAILKTDVSFKTHSGTTHLDEGTEIKVEPEDNIGYYNGNYFDLKENEYKISYLN
jgi:hypothetical protein